MGSPKKPTAISLKILSNFFAFLSLFIILLLALRFCEPHYEIILFKPMFFPINASPSSSSSNFSDGINAINHSSTVPYMKIYNTNTKNQEHGNGELMKKDQDNCDIFDGRWVFDGSSPSYEPGSCPFIDEGFNCFKNGRPDSNYTKWRWQPKSCELPRIEAKKMLDMLKGKRLAFVGDSLNRNMWESLICILTNSLKDKTRVFEVSGRKEFKTENSYAFRFTDYNCSIEYFRSSFLVREWKAAGPNGTEKETLRLDLIENFTHQYKDADVLIFNTGHWWTHVKTSEGKDYYQEGNHVHSQLNADEALRRAMRTWANWVETNIDTNKTRVFFRGYSSSHFGGGSWNKGGNCDGETVPVTDDAQLIKAPKLVEMVESVIKEMKKPAVYLNVTRMTDYRKDAHPSRYRGHLENQDCSHWCLPGVPDVWNQMLYAMLLRELS